jgi:nicotinamidase/pyrazinamidase
MPQKALILVDLQNDFCPGGKLAVPKGDEVIQIANELQAFFDVIIATLDWHPQDHVSFAANHPGTKIYDVIQVKGIQQILWPEHCVQGSKGAEFHPDLMTYKIEHIFHKGIEKDIDSYSTFFDNAHLRSTGLGDFLKDKKIDEIYLMGLATDYCVKYSALDAIHLGFTVYVIQDGCRGIDLKPGDIDKAFAEMTAAGVKLIQSKDLY